jgi:RimJ/RimL family protein N-acetyltransferase
MTLPFQRTRRPIEVLPPVELSTDRLLFRPLSLADRRRVLDAVRHSRESLLGRIPLNRSGETDEAMFHRWVETGTEADSNRTAWRRAAFLESGVFVGIFNLIKLDFGLEWCCEAHWWIDRRFTGRGYASEGAQAIMVFATADRPVGLGMTAVRAMIQPNNHASIRVAERAGMRPTGRTELLPVGQTDRPHLIYERGILATQS